jgi:hypothetical protein
MYDQFTYTENYDAQPTRVFINNNWLVNALQKQTGSLREFAIPFCGYPHQVQREMERRHGNARRSGNETVSGKNFLVWPEEYFKGPRLLEEDLPDWFMLLFQHTNQKSNYDVKIPPVEFDSVLQEIGWKVSTTDGTLVQGVKDPIQMSFQYYKEKVQTEQERLELKQQKLSWLQQIYARYEFYRRRASYRNGAVQMMFNPYIVPGFPIVIFDELTTGNHVIGYATSVTHQLSATGMSTSVSYTLGQTLDEYLQQILDARTGENPELRTYDVEAAPPNPVPEIRFATQTLQKAEEYFTTLFHQRQLYKGGPVKTAAFDVYNAIQLVLESGEVVRVDDTREVLFGDYLQKYVKVIPTTSYSEMFAQAQAAMRFICRPVCTLEEYISFQEKGIRRGPIDTKNPKQAKGAKFYEEILDLIQGPGDAPTIDESNIPQEPVVADTRANWRRRLLNYRTKFLFQLHPQED